MPTDPPDFQWLQPQAFYALVREMVRSSMPIDEMLEKLRREHIMIDRGFDEFKKAQMEMTQLAAESTPDLELTHVSGDSTREFIIYCGENLRYLEHRASEAWNRED